MAAIEELADSTLTRQALDESKATNDDVCCYLSILQCYMLVEFELFSMLLLVIIIGWENGISF